MATYTLVKPGNANIALGKNPNAKAATLILQLLPLVGATASNSLQAQLQAALGNNAQAQAALQTLAPMLAQGANAQVTAIQQLLLQAVYQLQLLANVAPAVTMQAVPSAPVAPTNAPANVAPVANGKQGGK